MSQAKSLFLGTFPDMNGKRVKGKSCARTCSIIAIESDIGELSERSHGIRMDTRSPTVHNHIPDYPPRSSARGGRRRRRRPGGGGGGRGGDATAEAGEKGEGGRGRRTTMTTDDDDDGDDDDDDDDDER